MTGPSSSSSLSGSPSNANIIEKKDGKKRALSEESEMKGNNKRKNKSEDNNDSEEGGSKPVPPPAAKKARGTGLDTITCHQDHKPHDKVAGNWLQCTSTHGRKKGPCLLYFCTRCLHNKYEIDVAKVKAEGEADSWICPTCNNLCQCATCRRRLEALAAAELGSVPSNTSSSVQEFPSFKKSSSSTTTSSTSKSTPASTSTASTSKSKSTVSNSTSPFGSSKVSNLNPNSMNIDINSDSSLSELGSDSLSELSDIDEKPAKKKVAPNKKGGRVSVVKATTGGGGGGGGGSDTSASTSTTVSQSKSKSKSKPKPIDTISNEPSTSTASTPAPGDNVSGSTAPGVPIVRKPMPPRGPKIISAPQAIPIFLPSSPSKPGLPTSAILSAMHFREYILRFQKFMPSLSPLPAAKVSKKKKPQGRTTRGNQQQQSTSSTSHAKKVPGVLSYAAAKARETRRLSILASLDNLEEFWTKDSDLAQRAILQGLFELVVGPAMAYHERDILSSYDTLALFRETHKALHAAGPNTTTPDLTHKPWNCLNRFLEAENWKWVLEPELAILEEFGVEIGDDEGGRSRGTRREDNEVGPVQRMRMILAFIEGSYSATLMKKDVIDGIEVERSQRAELNRRKFKVRGELAEEKSNLNKSKPVQPSNATPGSVSGDRILKEWKDDIAKIDEKIKEIEKIKTIEGWKVQQELHRMACATRIRFSPVGIDVEGRTYYILAPTPESNYPFTKSLSALTTSNSNSNNTKVTVNGGNESDVDELDEDQEVEDEGDYPLPWTILVHGIPFPPPLPVEVKATLASIPVASTSTSASTSTPVDKNSTPTTSTLKDIFTPVRATPAPPTKLDSPPPPPKADVDQSDTWFSITAPEEMAQLKLYLDYQVKYFNFEQKLLSHHSQFPPPSTGKGATKGKLLIENLKLIKNSGEVNEEGQYVELECRNIVELSSSISTFYQYIEMCREDQRVKNGGKKVERRESSEELSELESSEEEEEEEEEGEEEEDSDPEVINGGSKKPTNRSTSNSNTNSNSLPKGKPILNYAEVSEDENEFETDEEEKVIVSNKKNKGKGRAIPTTRSSSVSTSSNNNTKKNPYKSLGKMAVDDDEEEFIEEEEEVDELESEEEEEIVADEDITSSDSEDEDILSE